MKCILALALLGLCSALPTPQDPPPPESPEDAAVRIHNEARNGAGPRAPIGWDPALAADAAGYAATLAASKVMVHSGVADVGENLYMGWGAAGFADAALWWRDREAGAYPGPAPVTPEIVQAAGHYTQMIWPATTRVGMGQATADDGSVWIVARYSPGGNVLGESAI